MELVSGVPALLGAVLNIVVPKLWTVIDENHKLRSGLEDDIDFIQNELRMIAAAITEHPSPSNEVRRKWIEELREVAYDMEDCIERFMLMHRVARERKPWLLFRRRGHRSMTMFARKIQGLRTRSKEACDRRDRCTDDPSSTPAPSGAGAATFSAPEHLHSPPAGRLVGMDDPCTNLLELVRGSERQWERKLKVISIVGFGGLGKTLLAKRVYDIVECEFRPRVRVRAADKAAAEVLNEILEEILKTETDVPDEPDVPGRLRSYLRTRRYLIVIDDIRMAEWDTIKSALPDAEWRSRIIVTTTVQSVATRCSDNGYVFKMTPLNEEHSKDLFFESASLEEPSPATLQDAAELLKKCDGLPLALVSMAQFLRNNGELTYRDACSRLGACLEEEPTLARMQRVLVNTYTGLSCHVRMAFLLYFCMFSCDTPIRRNSLIRRWQAEGFVEAQPRKGPSSAEETNLDILIDRNIIHSMDVSNNGKVKRCQHSGMMLEYISYKCMSENFVTFPDQTPPPTYIRRLSLHHDMRAPNGSSLSRLRTLAVSGLAGEATLNFAQSELLRVLDLEECHGLNNRHLEHICKLLQLLKYLSLGDGISEVPKKIARLRCLETLDLRRTKVETVPIEVIKLPQLKHLFGKFRLFKLDWDNGNRELVKFLSEESNLETLAGFDIVGKTRGFPKLIIHMHRLRKVKIWCKPTADGGNLDHLSMFIRKFILEGTDKPASDRSLSIFYECPRLSQFLESLEAPGSLTSLKLSGKLSQFPRFVTRLVGIEELCLSQTNLSGDLILAGLSHLSILKYLKLVEDTFRGAVVIQDGQFPSLERISLEGVQSLPQITVEEGALKSLESLHLLCRSLVGLSVVGIAHLKRLKEVALHSGVPQLTQLKWKIAARGHPNRPNVLLI